MLHSISLLIKKINNALNNDDKELMKVVLMDVKKVLLEAMKFMKSSEKVS